ncbi:hypothetical protein M378DRAFT_202982 [Amanita muscaria Koide BX008]|uniref:Uncharacterized protein n=1 Tax=Amanita muscaria (strain Koide BX008) TaxID=946122 RepID=A0A0C2T5E9_AMAMK|nr:hypothetical protein M378DRAFT_202982 [Amanita muscaria Koide BX008]
MVMGPWIWLSPNLCTCHSWIYESEKESNEGLSMPPPPAVQYWSCAWDIQLLPKDDSTNVLRE